MLLSFRVGEDDIDAVGRHLLHDIDAVAVKDLFGESALLRGCYGGDCHL